MKALALVLALALSATPVLAKDISITLNDQEQKVLMSLLDSALKAGGLSNLQSVVQFVTKLQAALGPEVPALEKSAPEKKP